MSMYLGVRAGKKVGAGRPPRQPPAGRTAEAVPTLPFVQPQNLRALSHLPAAPVGTHAAPVNNQAAPADHSSPAGAPPPPQGAPPAGAPPSPQAAPPAGAPPPTQAAPPAGGPPPTQAAPPAGAPPPTQAAPPAGAPPLPQATPPAGAPPLPQATPPEGVPPPPVQAHPWLKNYQAMAGANQNLNQAEFNAFADLMRAAAVASVVDEANPPEGEGDGANPKPSQAELDALADFIRAAAVTKVVDEVNPAESPAPVRHKLKYEPLLPVGRKAMEAALQRLVIAEELLNHLMNNHSGMAIKMLNLKQFKGVLNFQNLKQENKTLAYDICNSYRKDGMEVNIENAFKEFLIAQLKANKDKFEDVDALEADINRNADLTFHRMPRSIQSFTDFLDKNPPAAPYTLFSDLDDKFDVVDIEPQSQRHLQKLVKHVLDTHIDGYCWNGDWSLENWEIINGTHMSLNVDPIRRVGRVASQKDLNQIAKVVLPLFGVTAIVGHKNEERVIYPGYLQHLLIELSPQSDEDPTMKGDKLSDAVYFYGWYYQFLMFHPGLLSSKARRNLIFGIYDAIFHLQQKRRHPYSAVFGAIWDWTGFLLDPHHHRIIGAVYHYDPNALAHAAAEAAGETVVKSAFYSDYVEDLLKFLRHLIEHAHNHTLWGPNFKQAAKNGNETELFAAENFKSFFPELLRMILSRGCLVDEILEHWCLYTASTATTLD